MENAEKLKVIRNIFRDIFTNTTELSILIIAKLTNLFRVINPGGPDDTFLIEIKGVRCYDQENADMVVEYTQTEQLKESYNEAIKVVETILAKPLTDEQKEEFKKLFLQQEADIYGKINYALNVDWVSRVVIQIKSISKELPEFSFTSWDDLVIEFMLGENTYFIDIWNNYTVTDTDGNELDA